MHAVYNIPSGHTKFKSRKLYGIYICHRQLLAFITHFYHKKLQKHQLVVIATPALEPMHNNQTHMDHVT